MPPDLTDLPCTRAELIAAGLIRPRPEVPPARPTVATLRLDDAAHHSAQRSIRRADESDREAFDAAPRHTKHRG